MPGRPQQGGSATRKEVVKRGLSDPDGWIRDDEIKAQVGGYIVGSSNPDVGQVVGLGVFRRERSGPLVGVHCPDDRCGRSSGRGEGDRTVPTPEVEYGPRRSTRSMAIAATETGFRRRCGLPRTRRNRL